MLESILAHSRDCIKLLNPRGELEYLSASAKDALGLDRAEDGIGAVWRELWPESERPRLDSAVADAWSGSSQRFEGATIGTDGSPRHWDVAVSPVRNRAGEVTHTLVVSTEVTAQQALAAAGRDRLEAAESRAEMAGVISRELRHRLKNQLAVVNAVTKLLARHTDGAPELSRKLEEKLIAMGHAQDLLATERSGPLTAAHAVSEVIAASGAGDRVQVIAMPDQPVPDDSLQQIALLLSELQTNALKHGALRHPDGTVTLTGEAGVGVLTLHWAERCPLPVMPVEEGNGGFQLIRRLGAAGGRQPSITWHPQGIAVTVHIRAVS